MRPAVREVSYYPIEGSLEGKEFMTFDTAAGLLDYVKSFAASGKPGKLHVFLPAPIAHEEHAALAPYRERFTTG